MTIKNRVNKLEKTKQESEEIDIHYFSTDPDDPRFVIVDGERISKKEYERRNNELEALGVKIILVTYEAA
ncbi:MAG: hypothetical protein HN948_02705 [Clostridia bacterium]|jgi:hypothetical protein|nr:hypothetical protein [Clostridia bacterium]